MPHELHLNGAARTIDCAGSTPLLWVLRDHLGQTGTKFGCGMGVCGACVVLVDGEPARSCQLTLEALGARKVTTIEGLSKDANHPCQRAWIETDVAQCGYCQPAMILCAVALIAKSKQPTPADIERALADQICRCGTYSRIRAAVARAAELARGEKR